jgi:NAD-dependent deacetylase
LSNAALVAEAARVLNGATRIAALTGAGISAESGVPTFRDAQTGLWANFRPEDLATPEAFAANPQRVWEWYAWRRQQLESVAPNAGHLALAELQRRRPRFTLITQNVDGLHSQAGSEGVLELHGNIRRSKCFAEHTVVDTWPESEEVPPRCPACGAWLRPDVVWFGEMLPSAIYAAALAATQGCEVFLSVGTSTVVEPAASLPFLALERGAVVIEINPQPTPLSTSASLVLRGPAAKVLPELVRAAWPGESSGS